MVTASARGRKSKPSRIKSVGPICAPGPKHPQLIVRPRWYAEYIAMMNAQINTVERSPEIRSATPVSNHSPSKSSNGGSSRANGLTAQGGSIWYESTPIANIESEVFTEPAVQGIPACGFILAPAANRKMAASTSRPRIRSILPHLRRASLLIVVGSRGGDPTIGSEANRKIVSGWATKRGPSPPADECPYK